LRARDLGITIGTGRPGRHNAITDVAGVAIGHHTLDAGDGSVRTGVTVVVPQQDPWESELFAGVHVLNGNGEMTGTTWIQECGTLRGPIGLTNTHSVGVVRDALVALEVERRPGEVFWSLPVVAETFDGTLNDINGFHVSAEHVRAAFANARPGEVAEGNVGSGTGMVAHGFKGGIGTSSRVLDVDGDEVTVGVLVQANHGARHRLAVNGAPVGAAIGTDVVPLPQRPGPEGAGSIIVVVAVDAPLLPHQCRRLAQRAGLGVARTGGAGEHSSGDLFLAFATGNRVARSDMSTQSPGVQKLQMLSDSYLDPFSHATIEATEEAIVNALVAAVTLTGRGGATAHAIPHELLVQVLDRHGLRQADSPGQG
jgi:D-aminopeptidase